MSSISYTQGLGHMLGHYFQGSPSGLGPFYIGLGNGGAPADENATLADIAAREITGTGYARQVVYRNNSPSGWYVTGNTVWSPLVEFTNQGLDCWEDADFAFLTLSPEGSLEPAVILSAAPFAKTMRLDPGETAQIRFRFSLATNYDPFPEPHCLAATIGGYAVGSVEVFIV